MSILSTPADYQKRYTESVDNPAQFWGELAKTELEWFAPFSKAYESTPPHYRWFVDGKLNITHNCLDRHIKSGNGEKIAYIYNNEREEETRVTYKELLKRVNKTANALKDLGVEQGDRVIIYIPLTLEQITLMLACARIGAIHSVVYAGFSAQALRTRIHDAAAKIVCTATSTQKNGKLHDLLSVVREAVDDNPTVKHVVVYGRSWDNVSLHKNEQSLAKLTEITSPHCQPVSLESSTPLFILYTSGTTGTPKGIVHGHGGYSLFAHYTMKYNFDLQPDQIHWTAADTGWITGHSYIVYGALSNGITSVVYEGSPIFPQPDRYWQLVERYKVESFYTAPTAIRLLMSKGESFPESHNLSTLRIIGSVGEPINPAAWEWYNKHIGHGKAAVIDTWWQTETGGHMLVTPPNMKQKPGSAGLPFFGISPKLVNEHGNEISKPGMIGYLVITNPWPGALMTCWNNDDRFTQYWTEFSDAGEFLFYTGDVAQKDKDGYFTVLGRADDVINVAGMRIGTAEVESALVAHEAVAEAAVIGVSDEVKGEVIHAFVLLNPGYTMNDKQEKELKLWVRKEIGYVAEPAKIEAVLQLPKTRSGKIMRRILKAKHLGLEVGDTSTIEE